MSCSPCVRASSAALAVIRAASSARPWRVKMPADARATASSPSALFAFLEERARLLHPLQRRVRLGGPLVEQGKVSWSTAARIRGSVRRRRLERELEAHARPLGLAQLDEVGGTLQVAGDHVDLAGPDAGAHERSDCLASLPSLTSAGTAASGRAGVGWS